MTDYKIAALTTLASPADGDLLTAIDIDDTSTAPADASGSNKKITLAALGAALDVQLALAPSGATAQTFSRDMATTYAGQASGGLGALVSGTVYVSAIPVRQGIAVNHIVMRVGSTAFTVVSHGWYALLDSGGVVRAVTADQSGTWQSTFADVSLSVAASAYTTTYSGLYYIAFCATFSTTGYFSASAATQGGIAGDAPVLSGTAGTASTPPSTGTTLTVASTSGQRFYAWTT